MKEKIISEEFGKYMFVSCKRRALSFIELIEGNQNEYQGLLNIKREDIDIKELIIATMWSIFDILQDKKYERAFNFMHGCYMKEYKLSGNEADTEMEKISARYKEYLKIFRNQDNPNYSIVSSAIAKNISKKPDTEVNPIFNLAITIHLQETIIALGEMLKITDERKN